MDAHGGIMGLGVLKNLRSVIGIYIYMYIYRWVNFKNSMKVLIHKNSIRRALKFVLALCSHETVLLGIHQFL